MLTESEIHGRFLQLWTEKGDLLVYKCFVSLYPDYALYYDQIYGSIPPDGEVEVVGTYMEGPLQDSSSSVRNNGSIIAGKLQVQESHACTSTSNRENVYSGGSYKEHVYSGIRNREHIYSGVSNKEHICSDAIMKEHSHSDVSNQEHVYSDKEHLNYDTERKEQLWSTPNSELLSSTTKATESAKTIADQEGTTNNLLTNSLSSKTLRTHSSISSPHREIKDDGFPFSSGCSSSVLLESGNDSYSENAEAPDQMNQDCKISFNVSNTGQAPHTGEHCYSFLGPQDKKVDLGDGCCNSDAVSDDDDESGNDHDEAIAALKDAHGDLRNQVYCHVKHKFSQWVRNNQDVEFDISCLDGDFVPVCQFSETQVVWVDEHHYQSSLQPETN